MSMKIVCILLLLFGIADEVKSRRFSALQMFGNVINDLPDDNVIICPPAIDLALVQLYLAGGGTTETDLKNSLGFKGPSKGNIYKGNLPSWVSEGNPLIRIASRFYARKKVNISSTYQSEYAKYLNTVIENVDENESWAETINPWVTSQTAEDLEDLIEPHQFEDPKKIFLTNTVNFFAQWKYQFKPIADENFYIPDEGRSESVKMMKLEGNLKYSFLYKLDCHVVIIPFDKTNLDMLLLFPKTYLGIQKIEEGLKHVDVRTTAIKHLHLSMPQFKFKYSRDMVQTLIDLGVNKTVFTQTNLQELTKSNENFIIDSIMHSAIINFDDKGVKSDFATGVDVTESHPNPIQRRSALYRGRPKRDAPLKKQPNLSLVLNRPFLFAIMDTKRMYFFGSARRTPPRGAPPPPPPPAAGMNSDRTVRWNEDEAEDFEFEEADAPKNPMYLSHNLH